MADPRILKVWNEELPVTIFGSDDAGGTAMLGSDTLFNLGARLVAAGREVAYVGSTGATTNLTGMPTSRFLHANGPTVVYQAYVQSLHLMVGTPTAQHAWASDPRPAPATRHPGGVLLASCMRAHASGIGAEIARVKGRQQAVCPCVARC
jgi:hypothetical protein